MAPAIAVAPPPTTLPMDEWDRRTRGLRFGHGDELLAELARRYLAERGDQALGLAPTRLLAPRKARVWILFWTAARRVDDAVESGVRGVGEWRRNLDHPSRQTLAERCIEAFLRNPDGAGSASEVRRLLDRGLDGLQREAQFDTPRGLHEYLDLIQDKSATAMLILDRLLFAGEPEALLVRHAQAFAASAQIGDDCRDALRDLASGRCFVTLDELKGQESLIGYAGSEAFAKQRAAMCLFLLERADAAAARFEVAAHRETAGRLSRFWRQALGSGQVRPTDEPLDLTASADSAAPKPPALRKAIEGILAKRFPIL